MSNNELDPGQSKASAQATKLSVSEAINLAAKHTVENRLQEAQSILKRILESVPDQPAALNLLGVIANREGQSELAVSLITKAISKQPDYFKAHNNLGNVLERLGNLKDAADSYRKATDIEPGFALAHSNLGNVLKRMGEFDHAIESYKRTLAINPSLMAAQNNLGNALRELGKHEEAVSCFRNAISIKSDFPEAHFNLGNALRELGKLEEASTCYRKSISLKPDFADAHNNLGSVICETGNIREAIDCYREALTHKPDFAEAYSNLGAALRTLGIVDEAIASFRQSLVHKPNCAEVHNNLGNALRDQGKLDEATNSYKTALNIKPDFAEAHRHLSAMKKFSEYDDDFRLMEATYSKPDLNDYDKMHLAFGLGKAHEDLREYEQAFDFYRLGNSLKRMSLEFSIETFIQTVDALKEIFTAEFFREHGASGYPDPSPIFILGMPRSGTTLVEQIIASHTDVYGAGELNHLGHIVESLFGNVSDNNFKQVVSQSSVSKFTKAGNDYVDLVKQGVDGARFITDKMPHNFLYIGMIKLILPEAKIVHCCRDARDNCLSIYKNLFQASGHSYAYDLGELGEYYNKYQDLMEHWRTILPNVIYDIQYEDIVANQEAESRSLLSHCGLEWDEACLEFYNSKRAVKTTSAVQVRKPVYKDSVQLWQNYEKGLAPLLNILSK